MLSKRHPKGNSEMFFLNLGIKKEGENVKVMYTYQKSKGCGCKGSDILIYIFFSVD